MTRDIERGISIPMTHASPLRRLGWWALDYLYAGWRQVRAFADRADPARFATGHRAPIVVLPGVYEPWAFMRPLIDAMHQRGHPVHVVDALGHNRGRVDRAARLVDDYLAAQDLRDVVLLAHSKGGLIGKHLLSFGAEADRVRGMVAIATPFAGSRYARIMASPTLRAFSPSDSTIVALAQETSANARITSVFPAFDPHIPEGSALEGAANVRIDTGGHFRVLAHPRIIAEIEKAADA